MSTWQRRVCESYRCFGVVLVGPGAQSNFGEPRLWTRRRTRRRMDRSPSRTLSFLGRSLALSLQLRGFRACQEDDERPQNL